MIQYYFSGTGNSRQVAKWLENKLTQKVKIFDISDKPDLSPFKNEKEEFTFISPTHGFTMIWIMFKFLFLIPFGKRQTANIVITRAGWTIGSTKMFGLSGSAWPISFILLSLKNYKVKRVLCLDMPSNWIFAHPGLSNKNIEMIATKAQEKTSHFAKQINNHQWSLVNINNIYELIVGILLLKISFIYFIAFRFVLARTLTADDKCQNCGLCESKCPTHSIKNSDVNPYFKYHCESCMRCINICPEKAIQGNWMLLIISMTISLYPWHNFLSRFIQDNQILFSIISLVSSIMIVTICYWLFYFLSWFKSIRFIFGLITPTRIFRRYNYFLKYNSLKKNN